MKGAVQQHAASRSSRRPADDDAQAAMPTVNIAVFGKHPAWRDFISLNPANDAFLTQIYEGIYRRLLDLIQTGVWGSDIAQVVPRVQHYFVHLDPAGRTALGLLLGSRDQLGRQQPLLLVANAGSANYHRAIIYLLPLVSNLARQVTALNDEASIGNLLRRSQASLPVQLESTPVPVSNHAAQQLRHLLDEAEFSDSSEGLDRLLYQLVGPDCSGIVEAWETPTGFADHLPTQIRVPLDLDNPCDAIDRWLTLMRLLCGRRHGLTVAAPVNQPWADIIIGDPGGAELAAILRLPEGDPHGNESADLQDVPAEIRESPEPYTHLVPFSLDPEFRTRTAAFRGLCHDPPLEPLTATPSEGRRLADMQTTLTEVSMRVLSPLRTSTGSWFRTPWLWFAAILIALLCMLLLVTLLLSRLGATTQTGAAPTRDHVVEAATVERWRELCTDFYEWFSMLEKHIADHPQRHEQWRRDPDLKRVTDLLTDQTARQALDPRVIVRQEGAPLRDLRDQPPRALADPATRGAVEAAANNVRLIAAILTGEQWGLYQRLRKRVTRTYPERGWEPLANALADIGGKPRMSAELAANVDRILVLGRQAEHIETSWSTLNRVAAQLKQTNSPLLTEFESLLAAEAAEAIARASATHPDAPELLAAVQRHLQALESMADELSRFVAEAWPRVDPRAFLAHEARIFGQDQRRGARPSAEQYREWLKEVRPFVQQKPREWAAGLRQSDTLCASPALNRLWRSARDKALETADVSTLSGIPYFDLKHELESRRALLSALDQAQGLTPAFTEKAPSERPWQRDLVAHARQLREETLTALYESAVSDPGDAPTMSALMETDLWQQAIRTHAAAVRRCRRAMIDFTDLDQALRNWRRLDEAQADGQHPLSHRIATWLQPDAFAGDTALADLLAPLLSAAVALRDIDACDTVEAVLAIENAGGDSTPAAVRYQGWLALTRVTAGQWPRNQAEEATEKRLAETVEHALDAASESDRKAYLQKRIHSERLSRDLAVLSRRLRECGDPVLARFAVWPPPTATHPDGLDARLRALQTRREWGTRLLAYVTSAEFTEQTDRTQLVAANEQWNRTLDTVSETTFSTWMDRAAAYRHLRPDPRGAKTDMDATLENADLQTTMLTRLAEQETTPPAAELAALQQALEQMREQAEALWSLKAIEKNRAAIEARLGAMAQARKAHEAQMAKLRQAITSPSDWMAAQKSAPLHSSSLTLNAAFVGQLKRMFSATNPETLTDNDPAYAELRERARQLSDAFHSLAAAVDRDFSAAESITLPDQARHWRTPLARALQQRREALLGQLLAAPTAVEELAALPRTASWKALSQSFTHEIQSLPEVVGCLTDVDDLHAHPRAAFDLSAVRALLGRFSAQRSSALLADPHPAHPLLAPSAMRAESLRAVMSVPVPERLPDILEDCDAAPLTLIVAWRRLGEHAPEAWPATLEHLRLDLRGARAVTALPELDTETRSMVRREALARWLRGFARLDNERDMATAVGLLGGLDLPLWDLLTVLDNASGPAPTMPAHVRFNIWLLQCRIRARMCAENSAALALARELAEQAERWKSREVTGAYIAALPAVLRTIANTPTTDATAVDPTALGPARTGWQAHPVPGDSTGIAFSKTVGQRQWVLAFRRVAMPAPDGAAVYVATTELPLGLFADMLANQEALRHFRRLYADAADSPAIPGGQPDGPRLWRVVTTATGDHAIECTNDWLPALSARNVAYYPNTMVAPPAPGPMAPVNRLTPGSAVFLAASLGCRLPLVGELRSAQLITSPVTERRNLRDREWQRLHDHVASLERSSPALPLPGAGSLAARRRSAGQAPAMPLSPADGFVWFAPVGNPLSPGIRHGIGNVAELAASIRLDDLAAPCPADDVVTAIRDRGVVFSVLGGSAVSSPPLDPAEPIAVDCRGRRTGYADVGLRLAFSPPRSPIAQTVLENLERQPLITAAP